MACGAQKNSNAATESETTAAQQLFSRMDTLRQQGYMFGHQDDPMYGLTWAYDKDSSDVKNTCGDYPAVMGFELGGIEMGDAKSLDSVPFSRITEEVVKHHQRGGIVTLSWHPRNPLTTSDKGGEWPQGTAWDVSDSTVVRSILPGGSQYDKFQVWMQRLSDFLATLKTDDGQLVPIIFRPWQRHCGTCCRTSSQPTASTICSGHTRHEWQVTSRQKSTWSVILATTASASSASTAINGGRKRILSVNLTKTSRCSACLPKIMGRLQP